MLLTSSPAQADDEFSEEAIRSVLGSAVLPQVMPFDFEVGRALLLGKTVIEASPTAPAAGFATWPPIWGWLRRPEVHHVEPPQPTLIIEPPPLPPEPVVVPPVAPPEPTELHPISVPDESPPVEHPPQEDGHRGNVTAIAFAPDGERLVTASWDGTIKLWDIVTGRNTLTLTGHDGAVSSVSVAHSVADRKSLWLASGGQEVGPCGTINDGQVESRTFLGHAAAVSAVGLTQTVNSSRAPAGTSRSRFGTLRPELWSKRCSATIA